MSEPRRILLVGATGLVGRTIIAQSPHLQGIVLQGLARREIPFPRGTRMELVLAESEEWPGIITQLVPDAIISALGTTHRKAGSKEAFRAVDHDLVLEVARAAKSAGVKNFVQISSVGADPYSKNSYLRVKGETERDLKALKLHRLDIFRPGLLRGKRENDLRPAEKVGQLLAPVADLFLQGNKAKYRSVRAIDLAHAALHAATNKAGGQFVHEHESLMRLAREFERQQPPTGGKG
ncbi:NAD-dependent epimerase/dehydratase family protein [Aurantiacibacter sp. MUD11]|uniref:NAD-dependent epimerase/dehydratase family protein n=1 Tax=Aurantiacibacter sp. MUD11 TaxID=3003265 RepID=UPI0022AB4866|nr:NAD-dependent epimerase/dehydratase family protein [Aurantiacibacter sp. MUD11]WAT18772.1 NAD-dependent epimerase/dehydratase family protein [Aurantiacibacter sp. MUD11]